MLHPQSNDLRAPKKNSGEALAPGDTLNLSTTQTHRIIVDLKEFMQAILQDARALIQSDPSATPHIIVRKLEQMNTANALFLQKLLDAYPNRIRVSYQTPQLRKMVDLMRRFSTEPDPTLHDNYQITPQSIEDDGHDELVMAIDSTKQVLYYDLTKESIRAMLDGKFEKFERYYDPKATIQDLVNVSERMDIAVAHRAQNQIHELVESMAKILIKEFINHMRNVAYRFTITDMKKGMPNIAHTTWYTYYQATLGDYNKNIIEAFLSLHTPEKLYNEVSNLVHRIIIPGDDLHTVQNAMRQWLQLQQSTITDYFADVRKQYRELISFITQKQLARLQSMESTIGDLPFNDTIVDTGSLEDLWTEEEARIWENEPPQPPIALAATEVKIIKPIRVANIQQVNDNDSFCSIDKPEEKAGYQGPDCPTVQQKIRFID